MYLWWPVGFLKKWMWFSVNKLLLWFLFETIWMCVHTVRKVVTTSQKHDRDLGLCTLSHGHWPLPEQAGLIIGESLTSMTVWITGQSLCGSRYFGAVQWAVTAGVWAHSAYQLGGVIHHMTGQPPIMNMCHCLVHTALYIDKSGHFREGVRMRRSVSSRD